MNIIIKNAKIVEPEGVCTGDLFIKDGLLVDRLDHADRIIEADGLYALPGLVDLHVHFRDPGQTHKEDVTTGSAAAASGGVTSVFTMPNTSPVMDNPEVLTELLGRAAKADVRIYQAACITKGMKSEALTDMDGLSVAGAAAFSDDGRPVESAELMATALRKAKALDRPVLSHSEVLALAEGGKVNGGKVAEALGVKPMPAAAEANAIAAEIELVRQTGCPLHFCHVSAADSLEVIRKAKAEGLPITCETGPHYITFTEEELYKRDADYRMNPPLRTEKDRLAMIGGLLDGSIDAIATDHAPHAAVEKADFVAAPNGVIGLQTSLSASYTALVASGKMDICRLVELMSTNPAGIGRIPGGKLAVGEVADVVLFDPAETWTVEPEKLAGKSKNTPFKGKVLTGKVKYTLCRGRVIYEDQ